MKIFILNTGSSSVKYGLFEDRKNLVRGNIERIGLKYGCRNHEIAIKQILNVLVEKNLIKDFKEIKAVGHRVVHGDKLKKITLLNPSVIKLLNGLIELAPLHQPHNLKGIKICRRLLKCKQFAVFDTAFYSGLPNRAKFYAIPWKLIKKHEIERYGFHGISHKYVYEKACWVLGKRIKNVVTCHLGNGISISAIKNGKTVDTSMGFTPLEGCMMGSRSGDIDAGIIPFLMRKEKLGIKGVYKILNEQSGLLGICGERDMRDVLAGKDSRSKLALEMFCYKIAKYIGAYSTVLGGIDAIVFTAGIGEGSWKVRKKICELLEVFGVKINALKNKKNQSVISSSRVKVMVIPTDEEQAIATEVLKNF